MKRRNDEDRQRALARGDFHVLLALGSGQQRHGYAIKQAVEELTKGRVRLGPGTLYEAIARLEERGLIEESRDRPPPAQDHAQRRYYAITSAGRVLLYAEIRILGEVVDYARMMVLTADGAPIAERDGGR